MITDQWLALPLSWYLQFNDELIDSEYVADLIGPNVLNIMTHLFYKRSKDKKGRLASGRFLLALPTKTITVCLL